MTALTSIRPMLTLMTVSGCAGRPRLSFILFVPAVLLPEGGRIVNSSSVPSPGMPFAGTALNLSTARAFPFEPEETDPLGKSCPRPTAGSDALSVFPVRGIMVLLPGGDPVVPGSASDPGFPEGSAIPRDRSFFAFLP